MARVFNGRMTADIEGDFVVFLIGMRFNRPWKVHQWWPVLTGMRRARLPQPLTPPGQYLRSMGSYRVMVTGL